MSTRLFALVVVAGSLLAAAPGWAQVTQSTDIYLRAKPSATAPSADPLQLSLKDVIDRGLTQNLGAILQEARVSSAEGARERALSELLPHVNANVRQSSQIVNLAAFGFTGFPGIPQVIGPFGVFDARVGISAPVFDLGAMRELRAASATRDAEKHSIGNVRELVILAIANLYLESLADASRVDSAKAQVATAETLVKLAQDQQSSGIVSGLEVVRQQVQLQAARQRQINAENLLAKRRLSLARAIGLPPGQTFTLTDRLSDQPSPAITEQAAITQALASRDDLKSAESRAAAARAAKDAASAGHLPTIHVDADAGVAGASAGNTTGVYTVAATVRVPIFEGGATRGKVAQAEAELKQREAELADLRSGVAFEVQAALLDITSAAAAVDAARSGESLARRQLEQAQDRFRAGVSSSIELAQAQDALAAASDVYISSLYNNQIAKAELARALGLIEAKFAEFVGGSK